VLERSGSPAADRELVRAMILATRHGVQPSEPPLQLLVDIDLAILGAEADRYAEFELQIRAEYWWVPTRMYRRQRGAILKSFSARPSIYATHEFRERFERQARNNIAWGLEQLNFGMATFRWTARF
jgi:predicted metal-dependent HD superfamily phosphohydrolase